MNSTQTPATSGLTDEDQIIEEPSEEAVKARQLPAVVAHEAVVAKGEISVEEVVAQRDKIVQVMQRVMVEGVHYGKVPGVDKPTLLKPGAELLNVTFRLAPSYRSEKLFDGRHLTVVSGCSLTHAPSGLVLGDGEGLCSTFESKYAYRNAGRVCPNCGQDTIKKSKFRPKEGDYAGASPDDQPGWYCFAKVGGCGMNFAAGDARIIDQEVGKKDNPDLPDQWNTVLKMANKRALVAACLNATAASDIFTQDVEDQPHGATADGEGVAEAKVKPAKGWKDWTDRMSQVGVPPEDSSVWLQQATEAAELEVGKEGGKADLFKRANRVLLLLSDAEFTGAVDLAFAEDPRPVIQAAFAGAFGKPVEGPEWKIGPNEDRLTRQEIEARDALAAAGATGEEQAVDADGNEIEF